MEEIIIDKSLKKPDRYQLLLSQVTSLIRGETDLIASLSNVAAVLKYGMDFFWVGFYLVKTSPAASGNAEELVLGPFQGPVACTRIGFGRGVCGTSWKEKRVIIVDDVEKFPGHIACSGESRSEIVLPVFNKSKKVVMVLDVDSTELSAFDVTDKEFLEKIIGLIEEKLQ